MKVLLLYGLIWVTLTISSQVVAQKPLQMENLKLNREVAIQKLKVQENAALRQYFTKAGFKESEAIEAETYKGTDSEGEFQMDVVAKEMDKAGKKVVITTVEFRQGGKVTLLTAADDDNGNVVQSQQNATRILYAANSANSVVSCALSKITSSGSCQSCRNQFRSCILSSQPLFKKVQCLFSTYASQTCSSCTKTSVLSIVNCLF
ncbi:hypothetical protein [Xanthocytophaga agilis]|uniref:Uncharacterized protein n=1 Tax=Xanthocytophaga agilis TaxID=3048010 RepID=A0AAE3UDE2_9BACT|nr:hypothetical protein [Xanthocytophaga agilis]MDJ1500266.1 hypothetical protein [Xanthocytophaga agilis]